MLTLDGTVFFTSRGGATANLRIQGPRISETFPEFALATPGTINIKLDVPLIIANSDHRTPRIQWAGAGTIGEVFDLVRVTFQLLPVGAVENGWLYVAHESYHRRWGTHEVVLTRRYEGVVDGAKCRVKIQREPVLDRPYREFPLIVL